MASVEEDRIKKERSPSYPFISLRKAVERARTLYEGHRREPARLAVIAETWGYAPRSSGLQQTVGALKQFGLAEDAGSGEARKVQITDLARRIIVDNRPGAREQALQEAAKNPRLIAEYLPRWIPTRPSDAHCESELVFDYGFNPPAARQFIKVFDDTVVYAQLSEHDSVDEVDNASEDAASAAEIGNESEGGADTPLQQLSKSTKETPLAERLQVALNGNQLAVTAALMNSREVEKLIRILQANKALLDDEDQDDTSA